MNFEIKGLPCFGPIADLVGRAHGRLGNPSRLSYKIVVEIRRLYHEENMKPSHIARTVGTSRANVSSIIHGYSWTTPEVDI